MTGFPIIDSFQRYSTAQVGRRWSTPAGASIVAGGRNGNGFKFSNGASPRNTLSAGAPDVAFGWAIQTDSLSGNPVLVSDSGSGVTVKAMHQGDGTLKVRVHITTDHDSAASAVVVATVTAYYYDLSVSAQIVGANLVIGYILSVSGNPVLAGSASEAWSNPLPSFDTYGGDAPGTGNYLASDMRFGTDSVGDVSCLAALITVDGDTSDWTPSSGSSGADMVKEAIADDDATYVRATAPTALELVKQGSVTGTRFRGAMLSLVARCESGQAILKPTYKSGTSTAQGKGIPLSTSYGCLVDCERASPFTGVDWSAPELASLQVGAELLPTYEYSRAITIDHTKCGSSDSSNFPVLFTGTYSWLATVANGGRLTSPFGYDMIFATDPLGVNPIPYERVVHDLVTGEVEFHVLVPTLNHSADTVIYILYTNWSDVTDQSNKAGTWASNFARVFHCQIPVSESAQGVDLAVNSPPPILLNPSQIEGGFLFANSWTANHGGFGSLTGMPVGGSQRTVSAWVKLFATPGGSMAVFGYGDNLGNGHRWQLFWDTAVGAWAIEGVNAAVSFPGATADGNWHLIHLVFPSGATVFSQAKAYVDGVSQTITVISDATVNTGASGIGEDVAMGYLAGSGGFGYIGALDEVRVSTVDRGADWITAEYNNQWSPSTFYAVGSEVSVPAVPSARITQVVLELAVSNAGSSMSRYAPVRR